MNFMRCENDHDTDLAFVPTTDIFKASHRFCSIARQSDKKDNKRIAMSKRRFGKYDHGCKWLR